MSAERKLIDRNGVVIIAVLLLLCVAAFAFFSHMPAAETAVIERNGEILLTQSLHTLTEEKIVEIDGENGIVLTVAFYPDGAAVLSSHCPDKVCVKFGKLTRAGETAVCLPAKITLRLEGTGATDATTY